MTTIQTIITALLLYLVAHEGGHFLSALVLGCKPSFGLKDASIIVRYTAEADLQHRLIGTMGFGGGLLVGVILLYFLDMPGAWVDKTFLGVYWTILTGHFLCYPFKMQDSESNDFNKMDADDDPNS